MDGTEFIIIIDRNYNNSDLILSNNDVGEIGFLLCAEEAEEFIKECIELFYELCPTKDKLKIFKNYEGMSIGKQRSKYCSDRYDIIIQYDYHIAERIEENSVSCSNVAYVIYHKERTDLGWYAFSEEAAKSWIKEADETYRKDNANDDWYTSGRGNLSADNVSGWHYYKLEKLSKDYLDIFKTMKVSEPTNK